MNNTAKKIIAGLMIIIVPGSGIAFGSYLIYLGVKKIIKTKEAK